MCEGSQAKGKGGRGGSPTRAHAHPGVEHLGQPQELKSTEEPTVKAEGSSQEEGGSITYPSDKAGLEAVVKEFRSAVLKDGPGNLADHSTEEAKQRFNHASDLGQRLCTERNCTEMAGDALYRMARLQGEPEQSVHGHVNDPNYDVSEDPRGQQRKQKRTEAQSKTSLAEIVLQDFVAKKTGGGTCDHCSATMFLSLAERFSATHQIARVSYKPESGVAPADYPYHRTVLLRVSDSETTHDVDAWWPAQGRVTMNIDPTHYPDLTMVAQWNPADKAFVDAMRIELEQEFARLRSEGYEPPQGAPDNIPTWQISKDAVVLS
jgi:hypothetical protein